MHASGIAPGYGIVPPGAEPLFKVGDQVQTRDGRPARIICTDRSGAFPLIALVKEADGSESVRSFDLHGSFGSRPDGNPPPGECPHDLVRPPRKLRGYAYGIIDKETGLLSAAGRLQLSAGYNNSDHGRAAARDDGFACIIAVDLVEGQFDL